jgi:hypothetical protein
VEVGFVRVIGAGLGGEEGSMRGRGGGGGCRSGPVGEPEGMLARVVVSMSDGLVGRDAVDGPVSGRGWVWEAGTERGWWWGAMRTTRPRRRPD